MVFHSAVHGLAARDYAVEQIDAWAPTDFDLATWAGRMQTIQPFVVERGGELIAYADVQANGYIDHFFVAEPWARQGVGSRLMRHLHVIARERALTELSSNVSRTAVPLYLKFGFTAVEQGLPVVRGVAIPNTHMRKSL